MTDTTFSTGQEEAVHSTDGPVALIAGPGCGKTTALAGRVAFPIKERLRSAASTASFWCSIKTKPGLRPRCASPTRSVRPRYPSPCPKASRMSGSSRLEPTGRRSLPRRCSRRLPPSSRTSTPAPRSRFHSGCGAHRCGRRCGPFQGGASMSFTYNRLILIGRAVSLYRRATQVGGAR
jgi:hypothetical protein